MSGVDRPGEAMLAEAQGQLDSIQESMARDQGQLFRRTTEESI